MPKRGHDRIRMYDPETADYDLLNIFDQEIIEISSPPLKIFEFDLLATVGRDDVSPIDDLYNEPDIIDEEKIKEMYGHGGGGFDSSDAEAVREGEIFKPFIEVTGYYQEPTWTQELSRLGIEEPEELAITFNYQYMLSKFGKEIKLGDLIQTVSGRQNYYRVLDAYVADETVGWKWIHYHVIARKPAGIDNLILPD